MLMQALHVHLSLHDEQLDFHYLMAADKPFTAERLLEAQRSEAAHPTRDGLRGYGVHAEKIEAGIDRLQREDPEFQRKCDDINSPDTGEGRYDNELFYTPGTSGGVTMSVELVNVY